MAKQLIFKSEHDLAKLRQLVAASGRQQAPDVAHLRELEQELEDAAVLPRAPKGVVTVGSWVLVEDLDSGEEHRYKMVFPREADIATGRLSVLSPLGAALLGWAEGEEVEFQTPSGRSRRVRIRQVVERQHAGPRAA